MINTSLKNQTSVNFGLTTYTNNCAFINNGRDIQYMYYNFPNNKGTFNNCKFLTNSKINDGSSPSAHVTMYEVQGVKFRGCEFAYNAGTADPPINHGYGIYSADAQYSINDFSSTQTKFTNLTYGVAAIHMNPLRVVNVDHSIISNSYVDGIEISSINSSQITNNNITVGNSFIPGGIYLNSSQLYFAASNTITSTSPVYGAGFLIKNSGAGAHYAYRNQLYNLGVGIAAIDDNRGGSSTGLLMNCNDFFTKGIANTYDVASLKSSGIGAPEVMSNQGTFFTSDPKTLVRNQYLASCAGNENKWHIDPGTANPIIHTDNIDAFTHPDNPNNSCKNSLVSVSHTSQSFNFTTDCPVSLIPACPCTGCCRLVDLNNALTDAIKTNNDATSKFNSLIDGGNTQNLLNSISSNTGAGDLKTLLLNASPYLSDEVLIAYVHSTPPPGIEKQILISNSPLSSPVLTEVNNAGLPSGTLDQILAAQNGVSQRQALQGYVDNSLFQLQMVAGIKLNFLLTDSVQGSSDSVVQFLKSNPGKIPDASVLLINAYADAGNYTEAFKLIESLKKGKYADLMPLQETLLKLQTSNNKAFSILTNPDYNKTILDYANSSDKQGNELAKAILLLVNGTDLNLTRLLPGLGTGNRFFNNTNNSSQDQSQTNISEFKGLKLFPNPTSNYFNIVFRSTNISEVSYSITDPVGMETQRGVINPNSVYEINTQAFTNGVYFITLSQNNKVVEKQKIIIIK